MTTAPPAVVVERERSGTEARSSKRTSHSSPASPAPSSQRRVASPVGSRNVSAGSHEPALSEADKGADVGEGLFERDVEFAPEHLLTPHEAVDIAIPPVLATAAEALATEPLPTVLAKVASSASLAAIHSGGADPSPISAESFAPLYLPTAVPHQPGWQSPSLTYALERAERAERAGSPSSSSADYDSPPPVERGFTPATSPSPPLLEAKLASAYVSEPPPAVSPLSSAPGSPRSISPVPVLTSQPFPTSGAQVLHSSPGSPRQERSLSSSMTENRDRRRLSFMSYADLINIERGNPPPPDSSLELGALATALSADDSLDADRSKEDDELTISRKSRSSITRQLNALQLS